MSRSVIIPLSRSSSPQIGIAPTSSSVSRFAASRTVSVSDTHLHSGVITSRAFLLIGCFLLEVGCRFFARIGSGRNPGLRPLNHGPVWVLETCRVSPPRFGCGPRWIRQQTREGGQLARRRGDESQRIRGKQVRLFARRAIALRADQAAHGAELGACAKGDRARQGRARAEGQATRDRRGRVRRRRPLRALRAGCPNRHCDPGACDRSGCLARRSAGGHGLRSGRGSPGTRRQKEDRGGNAPRSGAGDRNDEDRRRVHQAAREGGTAVTEEQRSPEEIREDIEETREQLGDTAAAVAQKTDVKQQAKAKMSGVKEKASAKADSVKQTAT